MKSSWPWLFSGYNTCRKISVFPRINSNKKKTFDLTCQIFIVKFVNKIENPTKVLECKPIEMFWNLLKAEVYKDDLCAQNLKQIERKIRADVKKSDPGLLVMLFEGVRSKNKDVGRNGTIEAKQTILNYKEKIILS